MLVASCWLLLSRQARQRCQLLQVFAERTRRPAPEDDSSATDYLIRQHATARSENDPRLDRGVVSDTDLASHDRALSDLDTSRNTGLGRDHDIRSYRDVMPDVYQVIEFGSGANHSAVQCAAVNRAIGADLDIVADDQLPDLGELVIAANCSSRTNPKPSAPSTAPA